MSQPVRAGRVEIMKSDWANLRPMQFADIDRIHAIEQVSYYSPWSRSYFRRCLQQGCQGLVAEVEGRVEAYLIVAHGPGVAHLLNLCVAPEQRRRGLGRRLLRQVIDLARRRRAHSVILEVRISNQEALQLYYAEGFIDLGVRPDYYPAPSGREDARVLGLQL